MKLSQKLLALSGVAVADYACCAYDDYGIPSECGLTEKTPFAGGDWRGNACKAWEGNPDASFDGNDNACAPTPDSENWSSCGFQRHFPWVGSGDVGYTNLALGTQDLVFTPALTPYTFSMGSGVDKYTIGGAPFLGGVCKLWMPVGIDDVLSVNVAGVHLSGSGVHSGAATYAGKAGSVHCFSVVNPAEFLSNDDNIHNGNVAGWRTDGSVDDAAGDGMQSDVFDTMTETERQQGIEHQWYTGSFATNTGQTAFGGGSTGFEGDSNVGPNFDVVAHFAHSFCTGLWTKEDMQMEGDWGHDDTVDSEDYPYGAGVDERHDHTDTADKRFADDLRNGVAQVNDKYTCVDAGCDNAAGMQMLPDTTVLRWPNAGAFAGFYSFVTCANVDEDANYSINAAFKYVFHKELGSGTCTLGGASNTVVGGSSLTPQVDCFVPRALVVSLAVDDFRAADCNGSDRQLKSRWNIRQAGTSIRNCGPGALPDADGGRCSWNWNFNTFNTAAGITTEDDAESFFERSTPRDFRPWDEGAVADRRVQEGSPESPIQDHTITTVLKDADGNPLVGEISIDIPGEYVDIVQTLNNNVLDDAAFAAGTHEFTLKCNVVVDGGRDNFPDCYQGEEIHFEWVGEAEALSGTRLDPWATAVSADF